jgi:hypothetical protein
MIFISESFLRLINIGCSTSHGRHQDAQKLINLVPEEFINDCRLLSSVLSKKTVSKASNGTSFPISGVGITRVFFRERLKINKIITKEKNTKGKNRFISNSQY